MAIRLTGSAEITLVRTREFTDYTVSIMESMIILDAEKGIVMPVKNAADKLLSLLTECAPTDTYFDGDDLNKIIVDGEIDIMLAAARFAEWLLGERHQACS